LDFIWFSFDFVGNNIFGEVIDIWAKEIKEKKKNYKKSLIDTLMFEERKRRIYLMIYKGS